MKIFIDENISPALSKAMNHLQDILDENHEFCHAHEKFDRGTPDEQWLAQLQEEDNWVIVSKDRFDKGAPEKAVFRQCGITIVHLDKKWSKHSGWEIAQQLVKWWPTLSSKLRDGHHPTWYEVPWHYTPTLKGEKLDQC